MNLRVITFIMHVSKSPLSKGVWTPTPRSGLISNCVTCTSGTLSFQLWIIHLTHITLPQNARRSREKVMSYSGCNSLAMKRKPKSKLLLW